MEEVNRIRQGRYIFEVSSEILKLHEILCIEGTIVCSQDKLLERERRR